MRVSKKKIHVGIRIAPTQPSWAVLDVEANRQPVTMGAHVLLQLTVNSKAERKVDSLPPMGFEPATPGTVAHLSDRSAKYLAHPKCCCSNN
jgi:hypothetical protein